MHQKLTMTFRPELLRIVADRVRTSLSDFKVQDRDWELGPGEAEVIENADKVIFIRL